MIAMQIAENRFEFDHRFALQFHVHSEDSVGGRVMGPHGDLHPLSALHRGRGTRCDGFKARSGTCGRFDHDLPAAGSAKCS